jgi:hypothetical protein
MKAKWRACGCTLDLGSRPKPGIYTVQKEGGQIHFYIHSPYTVYRDFRAWTDLRIMNLQERPLI